MAKPLAAVNNCDVAGALTNGVDQSTMEHEVAELTRRQQLTAFFDDQVQVVGQYARHGNEA